MHSFKNILIDTIIEKTPKTIIEWGPGESTRLLLQYCPSDSSITSIENMPFYYEKYKSLYLDPRLDIKNIPMSKANTNYATIALTLPKIDLAFVDGRRRVECCIAALNNLSDNGIILLHDSYRTNYMDLLVPYIDIVTNIDATLVFRRKSKADQ